MQTNSTSNATEQYGPSDRYPRLRRIMGQILAWNRNVGSQMQFYAIAFRSIPEGVIRHQTELLRLIAQMGMGMGSLALVGGGVGVFALLFVANGSLIGVLAYNEFGSIGVDALTGLAGSVLNLRFTVPGVSALAVTATVGAGATAQIGAMRINEEIDALEVIGVNSISYLASTRVVAGTVAVVPLYCVAASVGFLFGRITTTVFYGQGAGVYEHYFNTFLNPTDLLWSFSETVALTVIVMVVHCYHGYYAHGGPAGVGEAVGRSVRTSMVVGAVILVGISLSVYGVSGNFHVAS